MVQEKESDGVVVVVVVDAVEEKEQIPLVSMGRRE